MSAFVQVATVPAAQTLPYTYQQLAKDSTATVRRFHKAFDDIETDPAFTQAQRRVYERVLHHAYESGCYRGGQKRLARELDLHHVTVCHAMTKLEQLGKVRQVQRGHGQTNLVFPINQPAPVAAARITIEAEPPEPAQPPLEKPDLQEPEIQLKSSGSPDDHESTPENHPSCLPVCVKEDDSLSDATVNSRISILLNTSDNHGSMRESNHPRSYAHAHARMREAEEDVSPDTKHNVPKPNRAIGKENLNPDHWQLATQIVSIRQKLHKLGKAEEVRSPDGYARFLAAFPLEELKTRLSEQEANLTAAHRERAALMVGTCQPEPEPQSEIAETDAKASYLAAYAAGEQAWQALPQAQRLDWYALAESRCDDLPAKRKKYGEQMMRDALWAGAERLFIESTMATASNAPSAATEAVDPDEYDQAQALPPTNEQQNSEQLLTFDENTTEQQEMQGKEPLSKTHPKLAAEWHPTKNGDLTPDDVTAGSGQKVWWKCSNGPDHEWCSEVKTRTRQKGKCPFCLRRKLSVTNSLLTVRPDLALQWHPTKNTPLTPDKVLVGTNLNIWWKCPKGPDHEWQVGLSTRSKSENGCPFCAGDYPSITNSLQGRFPLIAGEWHPTKNGELTPNQVVAGSTQKVWWRCSSVSSHEWEAQLCNRTRNESGCPFCTNKKITSTNSLATLFPEVAKEWHPTKNGTLTPDNVIAGSHRKVMWKCLAGPDHEWIAAIYERTYRGRECPFCAGQKVSITACLETVRSDIAAEWHPTKNGALTPDQVLPGSGKKVWWMCAKDPSHEWQTAVGSRTQGSGCPVCGVGWTLEPVRNFVASLYDHLPNLTPSELFALLKLRGLMDIRGKAKNFVKALSTGQLPLREIEKFIDGEPSLIDDLINNSSTSADDIFGAIDDLQENVLGRDAQIAVETLHPDLVPNKDVLTFQGKNNPLTRNGTTPTVSAVDALKALAVIMTADKWTVEYFIESALAKIWHHAYEDEQEAIRQVEAFTDEGYGQEVKKRFLKQYEQVKKLTIPKGYAFRVGGEIALPNLMQRHVAVEVRNRKRFGNWSGTGAGKTLSAVLASRIVKAGLTVICCPNSVVEGWQKTILETFPSSLVAAKTFIPEWNDGSHQRYLILNHEMFQQRNSEEMMERFVERERIDFLVVDEIQQVKQRSAHSESKRRRLVNRMARLAEVRNPKLHILGMSATPIINDLQEGRSMVELLTGQEHDELPTKPTVSNCMALHQAFVRFGVRQMPQYKIDRREQPVTVNCNAHMDEIQAVGTILDLERILTRVRLPIIKEHVVKKTLIYTHLIDGITDTLKDELTEAGWTVGLYTGEDKSGLHGFLDGNVDVLIGSSAVGTGMDGLQYACNRLIFNVLPWTAAEFEQIIGRIYRQGQPADTVSIVIPLTSAEINGEEWSWCKHKMNRLHFKRTIADAAVDGVVPEGYLRTPKQAFRDLMVWLERLESQTPIALSRSVSSG